MTPDAGNRARRWRRERRRWVRAQLVGLAADFPGAAMAVYFTPQGREPLVVAKMRVPHRPGFLGLAVRMMFDTYGVRALTALRAAKIVQGMGELLTPGRYSRVAAITPTGKAVSVQLVAEPPLQLCPAGCGHAFDVDTLGKYGCPNCHGEGPDDGHTVEASPQGGELHIWRQG